MRATSSSQSHSLLLASMAARMRAATAKSSCKALSPPGKMAAQSGSTFQSAKMRAATAKSSSKALSPPGKMAAQSGLTFQSAKLLLAAASD